MDTRECICIIAGMILFGWLIFNIRGSEAVRMEQAKHETCSVPCTLVKEQSK